MKPIYLLNETESRQATTLLQDRSLDCLSTWEPGIYRALTNDGDDLGMVYCTEQVANAVNHIIKSR